MAMRVPFRQKPAIMRMEFGQWLVRGDDDAVLQVVRGDRSGRSDGAMGRPIDELDLAIIRLLQQAERGDRPAARGR